VVHKIAFGLTASYLSVKKQPGEQVIDMQSFNANLDWILTNQIVWKNNFKQQKEDSTLNQFHSGFRFYLKNPVTTNRTKNPDGPAGTPLVDITAAFRYDDYTNSQSSSFIQSQLSLPVSATFSLFAGANFYKELHLTDSDEYYGGISIFISRYTEDLPYDNPDAPLSGGSIQLSGGTSKNGSFFQTTCILPSSKSLSLKIILRSDFLEAPYDKIYTGGIGFSYFSGK